MKILDVNNKIFDINSIGNELEEDIHFWVLEYSNKENTDFYSKPLLFLETFSDVRLEMKIGNYSFHMPKDWSILCVDKEMGDAELIQPKMPGFNERKFTAYSINPLSGFLPEYYQVEVISPLPETKWVLPKLKYGQFLCVPLSNSDNPKCVFITHQKNNKLPEVINMNFLP